MKFFVAIFLLASLGANVWQFKHLSEMEDILALQKATVLKQRHLLEVATKELAAEKENSARTVKSAQGLLDRTEKLMHETDRLAAENADYRQRFGILDGLKPTAPSGVVSPPPASVATPTPTPSPASGKKKK